VKTSPEQDTAIERMLAHTTFGCFDVQGAGKTVTAINTLLQYNEWPALITMPAHLVPQWRLQFERWGFPVEEIATAPRGCGPQHRIDALNSDAAVCLVSYNSWTNWDYIPLLLDTKWRAFVFDEAHRLRKGKRGKVGSTSMWEAVRWLRTKTRTKHLSTPVWTLTGTPLVRDASDIWPFLCLCDSKQFGSRERFITDTCYTYQGAYGLKVGKVRDPEAFGALLGRYSIRRDWSQIPSLAKIQRRDIELPLELDARTLARHRGIKRNYRDPETDEPIGSSAQMLHALRRLSVPTKCDALTEWLEDHPGPVLVLAWYKDTAHALASAVQKTGRYPYVITGATSELDRKLAIAAYQHGAVLIGTIGAMKEGWDSLQSGYQIVFAEQHFLSTDNEQAVGRLLRRGQTQPVLVTWMYALRSFDMRVRRSANQRQANIEQALDAYLAGEEWR
jgi:superfamily II DNA or RNA helicase